MFSKRLDWGTPANRLFAARQKRRADGLQILDLTETNPTRVGIAYPSAELEQILARAAAANYEPHPLGLLSAREALAESLSTAETPVSPDQIVLTASTSEAYSYLFKLLADPGDTVVTAVPSYPLLDHLTALESLRLTHFRLLFQSRWALEADEIEREIDTDRTRAVVLVHPNNPTGSFLTVAEQNEVAALCRRRNLGLISDEVFFDYRWNEQLDAAGSAAARDDVLAFALGGLSKSAGLPHWKLAWIRVGGPRAIRRRALNALELIADSYLSVATAVQRALPELLPLAGTIRRQIADRVQGNLAMLRQALSGSTQLEAYPVEGGWSAVLRLPALLSDEELAIELLNATGVAVQPGYLFDFEGDGFLVLSLLPASGEFEQAVRRLTDYLQARLR